MQKCQMSFLSPNQRYQRTNEIQQKATVCAAQLGFDTSRVTEDPRTGGNAADRQLAMSTAVVPSAEAEVTSASGRQTAAVVLARAAAVRSPTDVRTEVLTLVTGTPRRTDALVAVRQITTASGETATGSRGAAHARGASTSMTQAASEVVRTVAAVGR